MSDRRAIEHSTTSVKCVVVGDAAVGKTSSLISYTTNRFPDGYLPTVFDNFSVKVLADKTMCTLGLFDTASQEDYDRLRLFSYPESDVIIVCFSVVKPSSLQNVKTKWLPEIARYCPGVPYLLVGMQTDLRTDPATLQSLRKKGQTPVTTRQGQREARRLGAAVYLECSALTQEGIKNVFDNAIITSLEPPRVSRFPRVSKIFKVFQRHLLLRRSCIS